MDNGVSSERVRERAAGRCPAQLVGLVLALVAALGLSLVSQRQRSNSALESTPTPLPRLLSETGLYLPGTKRVDPKNFEFVPQYPLWSDGARKRRWIRLPEGKTINASNPDEFEFPIGTKLWKEFSFGRAVETRTLERLADGSWRFATYAWDEEGREARLVSDDGMPAAARVGPGLVHDIPSQRDCRACHEGRNNPVLGFTALQLSPVRDARAPHREAPAESGVDLPELVRRGALVNLPARFLDDPPLIAGSSEHERALRGYLYGNCSSCHNRQGPLASLGLDFDVSLESGAPNSLRTSALGRASRFQPPGRTDAQRLDPNEPLASVILFRMQSREPAFQMPPLGTHRVDAEAVQLLTRFLSDDLSSPTGPTNLEKRKETKAHDH